MIKVKKCTLLLIAGFVWTVAGFNIARIGISVYILLTVIVFAIFQKFVFGRLVKNKKRITTYKGEYKFFWNFFDVKPFILMAVMMTGGIYLRAAKLILERFIAVFYSGLGISLLMAGVLFFCNYVRTVHLKTIE